MNPKGPPLTQPSWVLSLASQSCLGPFERLVNNRHLFLVAAELGAYVLAWGLMQPLFWVWAPTSLCPLTVVGTGALTIVGAPASCPDPYPKAPPPKHHTRCFTCEFWGSGCLHLPSQLPSRGMRLVATLAVVKMFIPQKPGNTVGQEAS